MQKTKEKTVVLPLKKERFWKEWGFLFRPALSLIGAFLLARGQIFSQPVPLGIAFFLAVDKEEQVFAFLGALLGYLFLPQKTSGTPFLAAILLAAAARFLLPGRWRKAHPQLESCLISAGTVFLPTMLLPLGEGYFWYDLTVSLALSFFAAASCWLFHRGLPLFRERQRLEKAGDRDFSCLVICGFFFLLALDSFHLGELSAGRIAAVAVILLCAKGGRTGGGAAVGAAAGTLLGIFGGDFLFLSAAYSFGGLLAGLFSDLGRVLQSVVFFLCAGVTALSLGSEWEAWCVLYETLLGCVLFLLIPPTAIGSLWRMEQVKSAAGTSAQKLLLERVGQARETLAQVSESIRAVCQRICQEKGETLGDVFAETAGGVCRSCSKKTACWTGGYQDVMDGFSDLSAALREKGEITVADFTGYLKQNCVKKEELTAQLQKESRLFFGRAQERNRWGSIRGAVTDQFDGMGLWLEDLQRQLALMEEPPQKEVEKAAVFLQSGPLKGEEVFLWRDPNGRLAVECQLPEYRLARADEALTLALSELCGADLEMPVRVRAGEKTALRWLEKGQLPAETAIRQILCDGERVCGDQLAVIRDGCGQIHLLLSDGMGSGKKAALDASVTAGLLGTFLSAGFSFDSALQLVNGALLVKGEEESLSTVDGVTLDLFSRTARFVKAGAAPSFLLRGNSVRLLEGASLPAGILKGIEPACKSIRLQAEDVIVLVSDGMLPDGDGWLRDQIRLSKDKSAEEMAQDICDTARRRQRGKAKDDASVLVCRLQKA